MGERNKYPIVTFQFPSKLASFFLYLHSPWLLFLDCRITAWSCFLSFLLLRQTSISLFAFIMNIASALVVQTWTFYAVVVSVIFARLVFRRIMLKSFANLQADDWIMIFLLLPFTASMVFTVPIATSGSAKQLVYRYVHEELQIVITWFVKACILILHRRIL